MSQQERPPHFRTAITAIFKNWTALQLAVNHVSGWYKKIKFARYNFFPQNAGGPQSKEKAEWMEESLETWFYENKDLEPYEVWIFDFKLH